MSPNLRFEFRVLSQDGDVIAEDWTTFTADRIGEFGGVETVDIHTGAALRALRRDFIRGRGVFAEPVADEEDAACTG